MSTSEPTFFRRTLENSVSGTVAGIAVCLVGHPFDTLKVRLQTQPVHKPVYNGLLDCFVKTWKWEGIGGLYKGVGSPLVGQMFFRACLFSSYYQVSTYMAGTERVGKRLKSSEYFVCGAITGFIASFVEGPVDLFKTKMQIQIIRAKSGANVQYRHVFHAAAVIGRQYGIRGVYQGLPATFLRNTPAFGCYFGFFELSRDYFTPEGGSVADLPSWALFVSGGFAGLLYWLLTYPTDVIKSALQSDDSQKSKRQFHGILHCAKKLYVEEGGWRRFFRGFTPCLMRSIPANATMLFTLEKCRQFFAKHKT